MVDNIAQMFLNFSHDTMIVPIVILGYIWISRPVFYGAICLVLMSMIYNFALKYYFQVPFPMHIGKSGFSFPSGHMQSSYVLYGWIALMMRNWLIRSILVILIIGIGAGLVYFGYHNYYDVLGSVFFGSLLISVYYFVSTRYPNFSPWFILILSTTWLAYVGMNYRIESHLLLAYYALIGFISAEKLFDNKIAFKTTLSKALTTIVCFILLLLVKTCFSMEQIKQLPEFLNQLQWAFIGFSIPASNVIANKMTDFLITKVA